MSTIDDYKVGMTVYGKITGIKPYGAFVKFDDGVSGLITSIGSGKVKKIWMPVDNAYTIQALYRLGIKWPFVSEEYIYNFVKYLDDLDFFSV